MRKRELRKREKLLKSRINFIQSLLVVEHLRVSDNDWTDGFMRGISFALSVLNGQPDSGKVPPCAIGRAVVLRYDPHEHDDRS